MISVFQPSVCIIYRSRNEDKIHMNLLKEMFMMKIKAMLTKQAATIQKTKDEETLKKWRQNGRHMNHKLECGELPYDTDPNYTTMLSRVELLDPTMARQQQNKEAQIKALKNVGEGTTEIFKSLQDLENSRKDTDLSPRSKKSIINAEIQMLEQLQYKLQVLHYQNAHQDMGVLSLPVQGQHIRIEERKNSISYGS
ncbi:uncharacterized protein LOC111863197 [Cryptotermes secundus]|uniref:uncharacterized protein LOC111863197 n=1 Tax=Cryptotermes secundus TaxID=105785 RepID=UPI001454DCAB|nr:uncharacterized protein LOC111863197 [Cryptotermes secundus]